MIFRNRRDDISFVEKENPYYLSFSDLMSGLLLIFILLTISLAINLIQKRKDLEKTRKKNFDRTTEIQNLIESIRKELNEKGIVVEIDKSILIIPEKEVGFESGSHDLDLNDKRTLNLIGSTIQKVLLKDDKFLILESIFVEGHTDSKKFSECYKIPSGRECVFDKDHDGNWELSVFRAISVLKHFEAHRLLFAKLYLLNLLFLPFLIPLLCSYFFFEVT